jgi:hypothetical protein
VEAPTLAIGVIIDFSVYVRDKGAHGGRANEEGNRESSKGVYAHRLAVVLLFSATTKDESAERRDETAV